MLANLFRERGVRVDRTYQLNFGGNTDFLNMLERERLESKKISKTQAVTSQLGVPLPPDDIHVGPSDHVPWLTDRKWAYIRLEGTTFGGVPLNAELKLEVWDSPNSAGVVIDAVRCAKLALDRGDRRRADRPVELLHEVAAGAVHRCRERASGRSPSSPADGETQAVTTTFFLVRHAAHDNLGAYLAGRMPGVRLGEAGSAQAGRLAKRHERARPSPRSSAARASGPAKRRARLPRAA